MGVAVASPANAAEPVHAFLTHAAFFSLESKQEKFVDPQAFVVAAGSPSATGPQGIVHAAGFLTASPTDDPVLPAFTAEGKPLGFTLATWFGARGLLIGDPTAAHPRMRADFTNLVPNGVYSLFENHFSPTGVTFTPLEGAGTANSFTADSLGTAEITVDVPEPMTHANAVLLLYHSDGKPHGLERGVLGVTARHQLIYRF